MYILPCFLKVCVVTTEAYLRKLDPEICCFSTQTDLLKELDVEKSVSIFPTTLTDLINRIICPVPPPKKRHKLIPLF